jgi:hypothetical protein
MDLGRILRWVSQPNGIKEGPNLGLRIPSVFGRFRLHGNTDIFFRRVRDNQKTIFPHGPSYNQNFPLFFRRELQQGRERETDAGQSAPGEFTTIYGSSGAFFTIMDHRRSPSRTVIRVSLIRILFVYYESIKRESKIRGINKCRCDERLQTKTKEFTRLPYTGLVLELEHLKIETRLITERFANAMGECEN